MKTGATLLTTIALCVGLAAFTTRGDSTKFLRGTSARTSSCEEGSGRFFSALQFSATEGGRELSFSRLPSGLFEYVRTDYRVVRLGAHLDEPVAEIRSQERVTRAADGLRVSSDLQCHTGLRSEPESAFLIRSTAPRMWEKRIDAEGEVLNVAFRSVAAANDLGNAIASFEEQAPAMGIRRAEFLSRLGEWDEVRWFELSTPYHYAVKLRRSLSSGGEAEAIVVYRNTEARDGVKDLALVTAASMN